jgi:hypothetical protein
MRFERSLPIGTKLALTHLGALVLLEGTGWLTLDIADHLHRIQERASGASRAERQIKVALTASDAMSLVSERVPQQQTASALRSVADRAARTASAARAMLEHASSAIADPEGLDQCGSVLLGLGRFNAAL